MLIMQKKMQHAPWCPASVGRAVAAREPASEMHPEQKKHPECVLVNFFIQYVHIPKMQKSQKAQNRGLGCSNPGAGPWGGGPQLGLRFVALSGF